MAQIGSALTIIFMSAGTDWLSTDYYISCLLAQIGTNVASPADKDGVIDCVEQIQLTNMRASEAPSRRQGTTLASIFIRWIFKAQLITGL